MRYPKIFAALIFFLIGITTVWGITNYEYYFSNTVVKSEPQHEFNNLETEAIKKTVDNYCNFAKEQNFEEIKKFISRTPSFYWQYRMKPIKSSIEQDFSNNSEPVKGENSPFTTNPSNNHSDFDDLTYLLVSRNTPLSMKKLKLPVQKIQETRINNNHAKMRILFEYESSNIRPMNMDFFLEKEDGTWKIFKISTANELDNYPM